MTPPCKSEGEIHIALAAALSAPQPPPSVQARLASKALVESWGFHYHLGSDPKLWLLKLPCPRSSSRRSLASSLKANLEMISSLTPFQPPNKSLPQANVADPSADQPLFCRVSAFSCWPPRNATGHVAEAVCLFFSHISRIVHRGCNQSDAIRQSRMQNATCSMQRSVFTCNRRSLLWCPNNSFN